MSSSELTIGIGLAVLLALACYLVIVGIGRGLIALGYAAMPNDKGLVDASMKAEIRAPVWAHPLLVCAVLIGIGATITMLPSAYRWMYGPSDAVSDDKARTPSPSKTPTSIEVDKEDPKGAPV